MTAKIAMTNEIAMTVKVNCQDYISILATKIKC